MYRHYEDGQQRGEAYALLLRAQSHPRHNIAEFMMTLTENKKAAAEKIKLALKEIPNMLDRGVAISLEEKLVKLKSSEPG